MFKLLLSTSWSTWTSSTTLSTILGNPVLVSCSGVFNPGKQSFPLICPSTGVMEWTLGPEATGEEGDARGDWGYSDTDYQSCLQHGVLGSCQAAVAITADCVVRGVIWPGTLKIFLKMIKFYHFDCCALCFHLEHLLLDLVIILSPTKEAKGRGCTNSLSDQQGQHT